MHYTAIVTREDGQWVAEVVEAPGCRAVAEIREVLEQATRERLEAWLTMILESGRVPLMPRAKPPALADDEELMLVEISPLDHVVMPASVALEFVRWDGRRADLECTLVKLIKLGDPLVFFSGGEITVVEEPKSDKR